MKVACTVRTGGKAGGFAAKRLPIGIVYGIAITAMSFFTDPTISTLTSGTPSQNVDLGGLSFPRRLGVRLHSDYLSRYHLVGMQTKWMSYEDPDFSKPMGKDFYHEDMITREGWCMYYFDGKYPKDVAYIKMEIVNPQSDVLIRTFYFKFQKSYQTSLDGRYYVTDPILGEKLVKNGLLTEFRPYRDKAGHITYRRGKVTFKQKKVQDVMAQTPLTEVNTVAITRTMVRYSEKAKMVFLVGSHWCINAFPMTGCRS